MLDPQAFPLMELAAGSGFQAGDLQVEPATGRITGPGGEEQVDPKVMAVFVVLARRAGELVTREELLDAVWPGRVVTEAVLSRCIYELRGHLMRAGGGRKYKALVETLPKRGFRLNAGVVPAGPGVAKEGAARVPGRRAAVLFAALLALAAVWAFYRFSLDRPSDVIDPPPALPGAIAVLPFVNMSADPEQEYFADGITEDIITNLAWIENLRVISRISAMRYKDTSLPVAQIAGELGVDYILEGSVRREGDLVRVTAQLIDPDRDAHLWAETYDRQMTGIFRIQSEIARNVAHALHATLSPSVLERIAAGPVEDLEAYALSLKGRHFLDRHDEAGVRLGIEYLRQAIERDPAYARAHAWLADAHMQSATWGLAASLALEVEQARTAARRALELDPSLGEAWTSLGFIRFWHDWDWIAAEEHFRRAIELQPGYSTAHELYSMMLGNLGRFEEAEAEIRLARTLDPLSLVIHSGAARVYALTGRHDLAIAEHLQALELNPDYPLGHTGLGLAYLEQGDRARGLGHLRRAVELDPGNPVLLCLLGVGMAKAGEAAGALEIVESLERRRENRYIPPSWIAMIHAHLDDPERAFQALERGIAERDGWMTALKVHPGFKPLRSDPRFVQMVDRLGL